MPLMSWILLILVAILLFLVLFLPKLVISLLIFSCLLICIIEANPNITDPNLVYYGVALYTPDDSASFRAFVDPLRPQVIFLCFFCYIPNIIFFFFFSCAGLRYTQTKCHSRSPGCTYYYNPRNNTNKYYHYCPTFITSVFFWFFWQ